MKRSPLKPSAKPLQRRTAFRASSAPANRAGTQTLRARNPDVPLRKKPLRSHGPTMTPIRRAACGEECTLRIGGVCNYDPATSVWCHSNRLEHGKGMGTKAHDIFGCIGCSACHAFYDGGYVRAGWTRAEVEHAFDIAMGISHGVLRLKGFDVAALLKEATA
jgi:hypothetical protein